MGGGMAGWIGGTPKVAIGAGNVEAFKYGKLWETDAYRKVSPGEDLAQVFLQHARPRVDAHVLDFGCGTGRGALMMALLGGVRVTMIDFVRNSLDPDIRDMLVTQAHKLRFLKHDLEQRLPLAAELGFCTDVLEHIPPDKVDRVLDNILLAAQHVFFCIATRPDVLGQKLIGEDLHLTVQPFAWWLAKLQDRQCVVHWASEEDGAALFYVSAWSDGQHIADSGRVNVADTVVAANARANASAGWAQVVPHQISNGEVLLVGGGPSLAQTGADVIRHRRAGVPLVTLNGAYNWALEQGLTPSATIIVDARPFNARFVQPVVDGCKYLIGSQADPSVLEGLPRDRTWLWHPHVDVLKPALDDVYGPGGYYLVPGGSTVLLCAIPLLRMLGWSKFILYGCDSSVSEDGAHHAYAQPENDAAPIPVIVAGKKFSCHPWMVAQAQQFLNIVKYLGDEIEIDIRGGGLLAHLLETGAEMQDQAEAECMHEVRPGLWVGDWSAVDAAKAQGFTVLGVRHERHPLDDAWVPIPAADVPSPGPGHPARASLDAATEALTQLMAADRPVLVHCWAGIDRAPLAVAWYLHRQHQMDLDAAYATVRAVRPWVKDRRVWIDGEGAPMQDEAGVVGA